VGKVLREVESTLIAFEPASPEPVDELAMRRARKTA
jgi:hypothetical protein